MMRAEKQRTVCLYGLSFRRLRFFGPIFSTCIVPHTGWRGWGVFRRFHFQPLQADRVEVQVDERSYTSSRIRSMSPVAFLTGRIEARIRLPSGLGLWGAFWMLPANTSRGEWAATGEIDIMEVSAI